MSKRILLFLLFSFVLLSVSQNVFAQTCSAPPAGLTNFWTGDRNANDFIGANHGTLQNGASFTDSGRVGPAFSFDGTDDFVNVASTVNVGSTFSVEFWVYPTRSAGYEHLVSNSYLSGNYGALYFLSNHIEYWQGGSLKAATPAGSVPLNAWTHVALVYDGSRAQLYLNGVASGSPSVVHTETFNNPLRFGYAVTQTDNLFQGRLDEISLYNTALSAADVLSIFNAGDEGKCAAPALLVSDASVLEGNGGTTNLNFTITLLRSAVAAQVNYATADGTATQPGDYLMSSGTTTVPASGSTIVTVLVNGDTTQEQNETLFLNLSNPSPPGVIIADAQAVGTIFSNDCVASPLGIANWYQAEGNANDTAGGANGALENGAAFTNGVKGQAFSLDGDNDSVLTPNINLGSAYTIELWIYPTGANTYQNLVGNDYLDATTLKFGAFYFSQNHIEYWQGAAQRISSPTVIPLNAWTHVALVYDGAVNRLYVNGNPSGGASAVHTETFNNPVRFGYSINPRDQHFQGGLDEITFYNRTLSDAEILSIAAAGGGGKCAGAIGNTWTGSVSSDWHTAGNWSGGIVPTTTSDVVIPAVGVTNEPTITSQDVTVNSLNIGANRTLTVTSGRTLTVTNDLINNAALAGAGAVNAGGAIVSNSGTIETANFNFNRAGAQTLSGSGSFSNNLATVINGSSLTLSSNHQFGSLTIQNGATLNISSRTLGVSGNLTNNGGTFTVANSTVIANGAAAQTLTGANFFNLTVNNPAAILGSDTIVTDLLTLTSDLQTSAFVLTMPYQTQDTAGNGDVVGNFRLTSPSSFPSRYGNQFNRISITGSTLPTDITVNLVKSAPADFPTAVQRTYTITPNGGSNYTATVRLHYLDSELNGNAEASLNLWRRGASWMSQGSTARNTTENWVEKTGVTQFSPWTLAPGAATAAGVSISGRVFATKGRGLASARVSLINQSGETHTILTDSLGYFSFDDLTAGETYILTITHKRYLFKPRVVVASEDLTELNFTAESPIVRQLNNRQQTTGAKNKVAPQAQPFGINANRHR